MKNRFILMSAPNGARRTRDDHPELPIVPAELARGAGVIAAGVGCEESRIEIELENGGRLILGGAFDPDLVVRLVRGLSS